MISQTSEYAFRAMLFLARHPSVPFTTHRIAQTTGMPSSYLSKVLKALSRAGLVHAQRGPHGGFSMVRPPQEITLLDVVNAVDPFRRIECCPLGIGAHGANLCPLHRHLDDTVEATQNVLRGISLRQLLDEERHKRTACAVLPGKAS